MKTVPDYVVKAAIHAVMREVMRRREHRFVLEPEGQIKEKNDLSAV